VRSSPSVPGPAPSLRIVPLVLIGLIGAALLCGPFQGGRRVSLAGLAVAAGIPGDQKRRPNRLIHEKSPYLLQHAHNPVDWYPWGEEAFAKARGEGKPIFLSIGYSTCHWCHVMERESFENDSVAAALNRDFIAIKVDREERPDVDRVYMTAMQAMGMGGGWPLNVFLTPDLEPFYGGTYFPSGEDPQRPGMLQILPRVHEAWIGQREGIERDGRHVLEALAGLDRPDTVVAAREPLLERGYRDLAASFDHQRGGFGSAPKFPSVANLDFLLRVWARDPKLGGPALEMVTGQLDAMRAGGIHDQLGGGFHRYATDRAWLVPHFEKMLYDQALLARAYLEGFQATRNPAYAETARDVLEYVARDLASPQGAFYSAEDADSEGEEGRFYVWTPAEVEAVAGVPDAAPFLARYGVTQEGNFEGGASILHEARTLHDAAAACRITEAEAGARIARARAKLLEARGRRVRPHRDEKVITAWNGLMISALARAARVLGDGAPNDAPWSGRAVKAAEFVWTHLRDPQTGALRRRWCDGEAGSPGQLDDYAYYAFGLIDLYGATFDPVWLERAVAVTEAMMARFWDGEEGGFFGSPSGDPSIKVRMKEGFDGAELAGGSIATWDLQVLGTLLDRDPWRILAGRSLDYYARRLAPGPTAMPRMLAAMELAGTAPRHVVVAGRPDDPAVRAMIAQFDRRFLPGDLLLLADGGAGQRRLAALASFTGPLVAQGGRATAYVCVGYSCRLPTTDAREFGAQLDAAAVPNPGRTSK
jgi:hypothetical protein